MIYKVQLRMRVIYEDGIFKVLMSSNLDPIPRSLGGFRGGLDSSIRMAETYWLYGIYYQETSRTVEVSKEILNMTREDLEKIYLESPGADLVPVNVAVNRMIKARSKYMEAKDGSVSS